jgi:RNA polymerase sigma-B factor
MTRQQEDSLTADRLWADYARTHSPQTREAIVRQFERLAFSLANRFARRGAESEDLVQVALIGLVKAVDRFDPNTQHRFSTFATPTIVGELKRYFRDQTSSVHVTRGVQELAQHVGRAGRQLSDRLGRAPTPAEIAAHLGVAEERVIDTLGVAGAQRPLSLDAELAGGERGRALEQCLGTEDRHLTGAVDRVSVGQALRGLAEPLRDIIRLRYFEDLSQREVARRLGLSQMRVSRLERRALGLLRAQFAVN